MNRPRISVVVETITARTGLQRGALAEIISAPMAALARQTLAPGNIEIIVVVDREVSEDERLEVTRRFPGARLVESGASNYFEAKNSGARAAEGEFVSFLDGDCTPEPDWLERLISRFEGDVAVVAGPVRYSGTSWAARTFSVPDFGYILAERDGRASGFNLGNVAFRREILVANAFDPRIRRNGGCYLLFHQIRRQGALIVYEPAAKVGHALDFEGLGFVGKHYQRGYDSTEVYRLDSEGALRGTRLFHRFGAAALVAFTGRRILIDWLRLARHRRQMDVSAPALPYYAAVGAGLRLVELAGAVAATLDRRGTSRPRVAAPKGA